MRHLLTILAALLLAAPAQAQTMKSLMYNTTNGQVLYTGTNDLRFVESVAFSSDVFGFSFEAASGTNFTQVTPDGVSFSGPTQKENTRANLGLGATNATSFANVTINQTTPTNGLLFVYRTNSEAFLGMANLIASNNTTISNETLFRVGVAEATNRSAQFGFRSTNANGNGVAVFSVFGFNALMQIGADASTNAVIFSGGGTNNQVMTLIKSGATEFARPVAWNNLTNAATTRTNLGLPLAALTNTSNVTTMRALAGSTNTNEPFSGVIAYLDHTSTPFYLDVSNGIILRRYE